MNEIRRLIADLRFEAARQVSDVVRTLMVRAADSLERREDVRDIASAVVKRQEGKTPGDFHG